MTNSAVKSAKSKIDLCWHLFLVLALGMGASLLPDMASATATYTGKNAIEVGLCNIVALLTSTTGKAIATIAVIAIGIGALLGKISWGTALIVGLGIMLVFGAATIVQSVANQNLANCTAGAITTS